MDQPHPQVSARYSSPIFLDNQHYCY
uniref:Uncharacterized protein n=1 Tax=Arundo donax TaxID=35708 RepID=A0A0A9HF38_ARUDO